MVCLSHGLIYWLKQSWVAIKKIFNDEEICDGTKFLYLIRAKDFGNQKKSQKNIALT